MMRDRRDKFTYTSLDQIKFEGERNLSQGRDRSLRQLRDLIEEHDLDPSMVVQYVSDHLDEFRRRGSDDGTDLPQP